jgi:hypothetical protein
MPLCVLTLLTLQDPWLPLNTQIMRALLKLVPQRLEHSASEMMGWLGTPWRAVGRAQPPQVRPHPVMAPTPSGLEASLARVAGLMLAPEAAEVSCTTEKSLGVKPEPTPYWGC